MLPGSHSEQTVFERLLHTVAHKINHRSGNTDELKARQWAEDERAVRNGTCSFQVQVNIPLNELQ